MDVQFYENKFITSILRPKMNCTVRFGKQFSESSPCLPGQQGTGQQGWYASGTLRKQFTKPTVQFILGRSILLIQSKRYCHLPLLRVDLHILKFVWYNS